jgi:dihydrofolate synthase/folylpolyglutamate synthase
MRAYAEAVRFLYSLGNEVKTAKLGLDRIEALMRELGSPHRAFASVHVAGTNGKGSTCAMIDAGLRAQGVRTGLFTSPHLSEPTERIRIDGEPVAEDLFAQAFETVHRAAGRVLDMHPTYFETVTAMAFEIFREHRVDMAVVEVGLGGRLDATNIILPRVAVITPIDFDHEQFLGNSIEGIAREKAGILKPGVAAVIARQRAEAEPVLAAAAPHAIWTRDRQCRQTEINARGSRFLLDGRELVCPLAGEHQVENALTAALALEFLRIAPDGIRNTHWPGRLEHVRDKPETILDGAHNPAGARALAAYIRRFYADRKITLIYGSMRDKAVEQIASILFPLANELILTAPAGERAMPPEELHRATIASRGSTAPCHLAPGIREALQLAAGAGVVFVAGSLFLVGEARSLLVR